MIDEVELVKHFCPEVHPPSPEARAAARRTLDQAMARRRRLRRSSRFRMPRTVFVPALSGLVVVAVVVVFLAVPRYNHPMPASRSTWQFTFRVEPTRSVLTPASERMRLAALVRQRLDVSIPGARVSRSGDELFVRIADRTRPRPREVLALVKGHGPLAIPVKLVAIRRP